MSKVPNEAIKRSVQDFWNTEACGERYGEDQDRVRYELEAAIVPFADFPHTAGLRLLEIGVGMGSDFIRFVRAGALATGIDLTERAIQITDERLQRESLRADLRVADSESLPFEDGSFDLVYSWGVLHHTPDTHRAINEAIRVTAPGGQVKLMLYHRHSWVALAAWARFCLLKLRLGGLTEGVAQIESPGTQAFTKTEVLRMLQNVDTVSITPVLTAWDRRFVPVVSSVFGNRFGWFLLISARKT